jgi:hypothetical protein
LRKGLRSTPPQSLAILGLLIDSNGGAIGLDEAAERLVVLIDPDGMDIQAYLSLIVEQDNAACVGRLFPGSEVLIREGPSRPLLESVISAFSSSLESAAAGVTIRELSEIGSVLESVSGGGCEFVGAVACLAREVGHEVLPGLFAHRKWNRADYSYYVLLHEGRPLHFKEIARLVDGLVPGRFTPSGFNTVLNADPRFVRVGAGDFGLPDWGGEKYSRFDEAIVRYLARGRKAEHILRIVADLQSIYTIAEATIHAMLTWNPRSFQYYGGGYWGLTGTRPIVPNGIVAELKALFRETGWELSPHEVETLFRCSKDYVDGEATRALYLLPEFTFRGSNKKPAFVLAERDSSEPQE